MASRAQAIEKFNAGKIQSALNIAKNFKLNVTKEERDIMGTGYECFAHPTTYAQMGYDLEAAKTQAIDVLKRVLGITTEEATVEEDTIMAETTNQEITKQETKALGWTLIVMDKATKAIWATKFTDTVDNINDRVKVARGLGYKFVCVIRDALNNAIVDGAEKRCKCVYDNLEAAGVLNVQDFIKQVNDNLYHTNETWIQITDGENVTE